MLSGISIEPFRGDLDALERMAHASWRDEYGAASFPNFYKPAFLRYLFDRIQDRRLLLAAYRGEDIVAFFANLPHRFHFRGEVRRAVFSCLLVTRKEELRRGLAEAVIREGIEYNKVAGFDFALLTLESGHRSTKLIRKLELAGGPLRFVKKQHVLGRVLDFNRAATSEQLKGWERAAIKIWRAHVPPRTREGCPARPFQPEDIDDCLTLLNGYKDRITLARAWDRDELFRELSHPGVAETLVFEKDGRVRGLINYVIHDHLGLTTERWAWFNHVAFPELTSAERYAFIQAFLEHVRRGGCVGALEWTKRYYGLGPLYRSHFFPYPRGVSMWSWNFAPGLAVENIRDVNEVQI